MAFHVPELMRNTTHPRLGTSMADGNNGAFLLASPESGWLLMVLASDGEGWEHVSIHAYRVRGEQQRTPTWREMTYVKDLFWDAEDVAVQYHPRKSEYRNMHRYTLHIWRPTTAALPTPPAEFVAPALDPLRFYQLSREGR